MIKNKLIILIGVLISSILSFSRYEKNRDIKKHEEYIDNFNIFDDKQLNCLLATNRSETIDIIMRHMNLEIYSTTNF